MATIDWLIFSGYLVITLLLGLFFKKRAEGGSTSFFLSGRNMPWWLLGISMVATTFAADTPLAVTGLVRNGGLSGNWIWWNMAIGWAFAVFFYARLWRKADLVTDAELITLRYSGKNAKRLRFFYAVYNGLIINIIIMSWVINAMSNILQVILGWPDIKILLFLLVIVATIYSLLSGFWGVVFTDLFQFFFAISGAVIVAYFAVTEVGGLSQLGRQVENLGKMSFLPDFSKEGALFTMVGILGIQWWAQRESSMPGYFAQRMFAARNEKDSEKAALLFNFLHYGLRPWPWILAAFATLLLFSNEFLATKLSFIAESQQGEASYALLIAELLPSGLKGFVFMSLSAAFMSTVDTHANWGASYLIRDLWLPLKKGSGKEIDPKDEIFFSRVAMVIIIVASSILSLLLTSVAETWKFLFAFTAGLGPVYLLRWYWHRINAEAEMAAMISGAVITLVLTFLNPFPEAFSFGGKLMISVSGSGVIWLLLSFFGPKTDLRVLRKFYEKVHINNEERENCLEVDHGWGIKRVKKDQVKFLRLIKVIILLVAISLSLYCIREILFYSSLIGFIGVTLSIFLVIILFRVK